VSVRLSHGSGLVSELINVVREGETRGGKEREYESRKAAIVGRNVIRTLMSFSSCVDNEVVRAKQDSKEKRKRESTRARENGRSDAEF
jgi:hypothetical protein